MRIFLHNDKLYYFNSLKRLAKSLMLEYNISTTINSNLEAINKINKYTPFKIVEYTSINEYAKEHDILDINTIIVN